MAARRNRRGRRRNRGRFGGLYKLLSILLIFAAILAGCVVFFRVGTVLVEGQSRYSGEEIVAASGVTEGENLLLLNKNQISWNIYTSLPYVDQVSMSRKLPDTLVIHVTESTPAAWVASGGRRWLLDSSCKVLEAGGETLTEGVAQVLGLTPVPPTVGAKLAVEPEQQAKRERLEAFLKAIRDRQMTGSLTSFIDLTSENEIRFGYGDNLTVVFPLNGEFAEKTYDLRATLLTMDERGIPRTGTLDLNYEDRQSHLLPKRWLPEGWGGTAAESEPESPAETAPESPAETAPAESQAPQGEEG